MTGVQTCALPILVEHFTDTINTWETAFITIADYLDDRDIDWQQLLKKKGIKNPLDNS